MPAARRLGVAGYAARRLLRHPIATTAAPSTATTEAVANARPPPRRPSRLHVADIGDLSRELDDLNSHTALGVSLAPDTVAFNPNQVPLGI